jgi:molybdopterin-containing oxidoreductase family membrane subunit
MNITQTQTRKSAGSFIWLALTGILTVLGIAAWVIQLKQGVSATSLSNLEPWGIYIAGFIFFMGLSAGSLVLAALPILLDLPKFRPYARIAAFVALIALVAGGLFILVDIGKPERLWRIVRFAQLGSPMLWDLLLTIGYLIISTVFLRRLMGSDKTDRSLKVLAWIALIAGVADMLTGFVFATQVAHEFWFSAVQPIAFFVAALASAGAVALLLMLVLRSSGLVALDCCDLEPVAGLTAVALGVDLLLIVSELITLAFTRSEGALALMQFLRTWPLFWLEILTAVIAILLLSLPATRSVRSWVAVGSVLAIVDLAVKRFVFVQMGFVEPNIQFAGVAIAPSGAYLPSLVEWGLVVGLIGLFSMLLIVGFRTLPLGMEQKV